MTDLERGAEPVGGTLRVGKLALLDVATLAILGCASLLTGVAVHREFFSKPDDAAAFKVPVRADLNLAGRVIGSSRAPVSLTIFADFQCPYCANAQAALRSLLSVDPRVKIRYRHLPLETIHPHAWKAALAAECAADQGAFEAYHDLLFAKQDSIGKIAWSELAVRSGVRSTPEFEACLAEERHSGTIERDVLLARDLGIDRTPTFVVGENGYRGVPSRTWLKWSIEQAAKRLDITTIGGPHTSTVVIGASTRTYGDRR
ncbi:MAG TPA: DsbA family protein [Gemmatimonadaceae bacterium]